MNSASLLSTSGPLTWKFLGTPAGLWMVFIVVAAALFTILLWLRKTIAARLGVIAALTGVRVQQLISDLVCRTHTLFLLASSLYAASLLIYMGTRAEEDAHIAFTIILLCQGGIWA